MSTAKRLPIFLLTGFLGSGKTTLLNALLKEPRFANTAVVVNEFGEIGLDHFLIEQSQDNVVLLDAGCLCCTISDSLHETLAELHAKRVRGEVPAFERVVIETTGLAQPAPILDTLLGHRLVTTHYRLDATIVTVDAQHAETVLESQPEVIQQIAVADRLLVTKTDLAPGRDALTARLRAINPAAELIESVMGAGAVEAFEPLPSRRLAGPGHALNPSIHTNAHVHDHDHDPSHTAHHSHDDRNRHDEHVRAHCMVIDDPASWAGLAAWWRVLTARLGERLLRCKGLIRIADTGEVVFIQGVQKVFHRPERLPVWPDADPRSRIVCIARDTSAEEIRSTLAALQRPAGSAPDSATD